MKEARAKRIAGLTWPLELELEGPESSSENVTGKIEGPSIGDFDGPGVIVGTTEGDASVLLELHAHEQTTLKLELDAAGAAKLIRQLAAALGFVLSRVR